MHEVNHKVAVAFRLKADSYEQQKKDLYRIMAFRKAANALEQHPESLDNMYKRSWLKGIEKIAGIGPRLARAVETELKKLGIKH